MNKKKSARSVDPMRYYTRMDKIVLFVSTLLLIVFFVVLLYPLLYAIVSSFTKGTLQLSLIPRRFTLEGYRACFDYKYIWTGFRNSLVYTVVGTAIAVGLRSAVRTCCRSGIVCAV